MAGQRKETAGTLINWLKKDEKKNKVEVFDQETVGARRAELDYALVKKIGCQSLLKIILKTGRSHQIRAQLSQIGYPIIGDIKYGSKHKFKPGAIALSAEKLSFTSATQAKPVVIEAHFLSKGL